MVLFISGRTDILTYYPKWLINRLKAGFFDTRNPYNRRLVSRIYMEDVDIIMFCTKNPIPLFPYLDELDNLTKGIPLVFHITITPYKEDIEPRIGKIKKEVIESVKKLSLRYGKENIFIRFDPLFKSEKYTISYHIKAFKKLCESLKGYANNIVISFIDLYKNVLKNNDKFLRILPFTEKDYEVIGKEFYEIAKDNNFEIFTCGERNDLSEFGFKQGACLSLEHANSLMEKLNKVVKFKKTTKGNNKFTCKCVETVDIGDYNSCLSLCKYCYANFDENKVKENYKNHDENSSLLIGELEEGDVVKVRK